MCVVREKNKYFLVKNGQTSKSYDNISMSGVAFSPDGKHMAFVAASGDKQFVVLDGTEGVKFDTILPVDGGKVYFDPAGNVWYNALKNKSEVYLVTEKIN
jgi:DNA-binding beta-propeller fold protein YncE